MTIRTRLINLLVTTGLALSASTASAAEIHARQFLSPQGQAVASAMLTADCTYRDTTGVYSLRRMQGNAGQVTCLSANGMRVATFSPQERYAEQLSQKTHGGIVLTMNDGRVWHSRTRSAPLNRQQQTARSTCTNCVPAMPSICCPRQGA